MAMSKGSFSATLFRKIVEQTGSDVENLRFTAINRAYAACAAAGLQMKDAFAMAYGGSSSEEVEALEKTLHAQEEELIAAKSRIQEMTVELQNANDALTQSRQEIETMKNPLAGHAFFEALSETPQFLLIGALKLIAIRIWFYVAWEAPAPANSIFHVPAEIWLWNVLVAWYVIASLTKWVNLVYERNGLASAVSRAMTVSTGITLALTMLFGTFDPSQWGPYIEQPLPATVALLATMALGLSNVPDKLARFFTETKFARQWFS